MKRGTPDHPKMIALADALAAHFADQGTRLPLGLCQTLACGLCERLWHFTARYSPAGDVGKHPDAQIARAVGWPSDAAWLIEALATAGLIDRRQDCRLYVHGWHKHADDAADKWLRDNGHTYANGMPPRRKGPAVATCPDPSRQVRPPEPEPEPVPKPPPSPSQADAVEWSGVVGEMRSLGCIAADDATTTARDKGVPVSQVREIIAYWQSRPGAWGPGALVERVRAARPGEAAGALWPESKQLPLQAKRPDPEDLRFAIHNDATLTPEEKQKAYEKHNLEPVAT